MSIGLALALEVTLMAKAGSGMKCSYTKPDGGARVMGDGLAGREEC